MAGNYVDVLFPNPGLIHDLERTVGAPTTINSNGNREYRLQKESNYRTRWKWPSRTMDTAKSKTLAQFITQVAFFSLNSFKFLDPYCYKWTNTQLAYTGVGTKYYLTTLGNQDTHPVYHLGGDIIVKLNGTTTTYTVDYTNDVPTIVVPTTGTVTISGTFYFAARIDQADYSLIMSALDTGNGPLADTVGDISLIEVFEY